MLVYKYNKLNNVRILWLQKDVKTGMTAWEIRIFAEVSSSLTHIILKKAVIIMLLGIFVNYNKWVLNTYEKKYS